jgi:hypothetical protein
MMHELQVRVALATARAADRGEAMHLRWRKTARPPLIRPIFWAIPVGSAAQVRQSATKRHQLELTRIRQMVKSRDDP